MNEFGYFGLEGQIALVTGASSGLGMHFAQTLAAAGCTVGLAARRGDKLRSLAEQIEAQDGGTAAPASFLEATPDETAQVFALNQNAPWQVAQSVCRRLVEAKLGGSIINIAAL